MEATTTPLREQRLNALRIANSIRSERAQMKRDLSAGRISVESVLDQVPGHAVSMTVFDLLISLPKLGRVKANKLCSRLRIPPSRELGSLTVRQRAEIVLAVR